MFRWLRARISTLVDLPSRIALEKENAALVREINHRLGNKLNIMASALRLERRTATTPQEHEMLDRLDTVVDEMIKHYRAQQHRYSGVDAIVAKLDDHNASPTETLARPNVRLNAS